MKRKGLSLLEILVASLILTLALAGLLNIFVAGKRWVLHNRLRMTGGELGKYFLDPLQQQVKQSEWDSTSNDYISSNLLHKRTNEAGSPVTLDRPYTPYYTVSVPPSFSSDSPMRKVRVDIKYIEQ